MDFSGNNFQGPIPDSYSNRTTLGLLSLQDNNLTGSIPPAIFGSCCNSAANGIYNLALNVSNNSLSGPLPFQLFNNTNFFIFSAADNAFSGPLPPSLNQFESNLFTLEIQNNNFSGPLPVLDQVETLLLLNMAGNRFSGPIPQNFLNWTAFQQGVALTSSVNASLYHVDLSSNRLNGSIPPLLGGIQSLNYLNLSNNAFTGLLPPSLLGPDSSLVTLDVRNNALHSPLDFTSSKPDTCRACSSAGTRSTAPSPPPSPYSALSNSWICLTTYSKDLYRTT